MEAQEQGGLHPVPGQAVSTDTSPPPSFTSPILSLRSLQFYLPPEGLINKDFLKQVHSNLNRFVACPGCGLLELLALAHVATLRDFITTDVIIPLSHVMLSGSDDGVGVVVLFDVHAVGSAVIDGSFDGVR